jgi:hypothetical protein
MTDYKRCQGRTNKDTNEPRLLCQGCARHTAERTAEAADLIEPEARRTTGNSWVCVNRIERVAA